MGFRAFSRRVRWTLFALYVFLFFTVPFVLLWNLVGLLIGCVLSVAFLVFLRYDGVGRISRRLNVQEIATAQSPQLFAIVKEYCRRLQMPPPKIGVIETPALNIAVYGFGSEDCQLVVTRGLLSTLSREHLCAILGRELAYQWHKDAYGDSWLTQYLSALDLLVISQKHRNHHHTRRFYPFKVLIKQLLLYPLTILPAYFLRARQDPSKVDLKSVLITRKPRELGEALRIMEAHQERVPFHVPFSVRHLFLLPPPTEDPVARVIFETRGFADRIKAIAQLTHTVTVN